MNIDLKEITVRELVEGYQDDGEGGVVGYSGKLDIRPPYQREFVYKGDQRKAVIDTITKGFPLNVMYWSVRDDGTYEIIDGQQRTISVAQYVKGKFSFNDLYFHSLTDDKQDEILDYTLFIYFCSGTDSERLEWFRTINIAGKPLTNQELRNAVYAGSWVSDAKRHFSRRNCSAYNIGKDYMKGIAIRQEYLETAIKWISGGEIEDYMGRHHHDQSADALYNYFQSVMNWVKATFVKKRPFMKNVEWGPLYDVYGASDLDPVKIEKELEKLVLDDDVTTNAGIYRYVLTRDEKHLNMRAFSTATRQSVYEKQAGECVICSKQFNIKDMEADHITPWIEGGKTLVENCQMLCRECNRRKGAK